MFKSPRLNGLRCTATLLTFLFVAPFASAHISGTVVDVDGNPVADATVTLQATDHPTTTASDGTFNLPNASGSQTYIVAAKQGWFNDSAYVFSTPHSGAIITMEEVPAWDDPSFEPTDPTTCVGCHPEQYKEWNGYPMSEGGVNLWLYDIYNGTGTPGGMGGFVYTRDSSHLATSKPSCSPNYKNSLSSPFLGHARRAKPRLPKALFQTLSM